MTLRINSTFSFIVASQVLLLSLFLFSPSTSNAQTKKIKIACIGNSITAGARVIHPEIESYPAVLSTLLQENGYTNYDVKNYGIGGATMLRFGAPNLWRILDSLERNAPDIVIIKAGTNETVGPPRHNWEHINEFEKDYLDYVAAIRKINPDCRIIVCSPLDMVLKTDGLTKERRDDLSHRRPRIWELRKRIKKMAGTGDLFFLDLTRPFKGKHNLMTTKDGVHPNQEGYHYLATLVFDFIRKKKIVVKD